MQCLESSKERIVTYQLTLRGRDGMVLGSDQCEHSVSEDGHTHISNRVKKVFVSGRFAWAYSGGELGPIFSDRLSRLLANPENLSDEAARRILYELGEPTVVEYMSNSRGAAGKSIVIFACGDTRKVFRVTISSPSIIEEVGDGACITGNYYNLAAFFPERFYSSKQSVDGLACLAAYSIDSAHVFEPKYVDGLDVAVYRDTEAGIGKWEFMNNADLLGKAARLDDAIRAAIS
jgi:hypothetical protein